MQCTNCGNQLTTNDKFCMKCGTKVVKVEEKVEKVVQESQKVEKPVQVEEKKVDALGHLNESSGTNSNQPKLDLAVKRYFFGLQDIKKVFLSIWLATFALRLKEYMDYGLELIFLNRSSLWGKVATVFFWLLLITIILDIIFSYIELWKDSAIHATNKSIRKLVSTGVKALNLTESDLNSDDTFLLIGRGKESELANVKRGFFNKIFIKPFSVTFSKIPYFGRRIGNDGKNRDILVNVTILNFGKEFTHVYQGNIDVSTSGIYEQKVFKVLDKEVVSVSKKEITTFSRKGIFKALHKENILEISLKNDNVKAYIDTHLTDRFEAKFEKIVSKFDN